jgi:circadian clock protein KaiC
METELFPSDITVTTAGVSAMVENIILLRYVELHAHLHRMISILKVRESSYDSSLREFSISEQGIDVAETFESAEAILSGYARTPPVAPPRKGGHGRSLGT